MESRLRKLISDHGVFTRHEALTLGYHDHAISMLVKSGAWVRVRRGAYVMGDAWADLSPNGRYAVLCRAALRQARADVALSHISAANEYGAPMWDLDMTQVHLTRTDHRAVE